VSYASTLLDFAGRAPCSLLPPASSRPPTHPRTPTLLPSPPPIAALPAVLFQGRWGLGVLSTPPWTLHIASPVDASLTRHLLRPRRSTIPATR
jgi:hypothetical protein